MQEICYSLKTYLILKSANMSESYLFPFLGFEPDPCRYEKSNVKKGDSYDIISSLIKNGSKVLEIGCGTGSLLSYLSQYSQCVVEGVEPNKARADFAKEKGLSVINAYLTPDIKLLGSSYDFIVLADVLEHLADPSVLLLDSKKFLNHGGAYIISVPNMVHWSVRLKILCGNLSYSQYGLLDATHLRWFSAQSIATYLGRLDFEIIKVYYTNGASLPDYLSLPLFSRLRESTRNTLLNWLTRFFPGLFACQIIVMARPIIE
jgi:methionine biosynthesis protein MetW